jgi:AAA+ ATPase superfamily predicted ATPase
MMENPYVFDSVLEPNEIFVGRQEEMHWIRSNLEVSNPRSPLILNGQPGIGKSSLLKRIERGKLASNHIIVYLDLKQLPLDDMRHFLWDLAKQAISSLLLQGIEPPLPQKRMFSSLPRKAFKDNFWHPLMKHTDRDIFFLFDHADALAGGANNGTIQRDIREYFYDLFNNEQRNNYLFSMTYRPESFNKDLFKPFEISISMRMSYLTQIETEILMMKPAKYLMLKEALRYIYDLTKGHPRDVQRIGHALFFRNEKLGLKTITVSDISSILEGTLQPADFYTPVYGRRARIRRNLVSDVDVT